MATDLTAENSGDLPAAKKAAATAKRAESQESSLGARIEKMLRPLGSLKLTVVLFALAVFLVFTGTMAQAKLGIWRVVDTYFRAPYVWIELQVFFPPSFFPSKPEVPGGFYFPGGWLIGGVLAVNLLAAHLTRFKVKAEGWRFYTGIGVLLLGVLATVAVILTGTNSEGFHYTTDAPWNIFWCVFLALLGAASAAAAVYAFVIRRRESLSPAVRKPLFWFLVATSAVTGLVTLWLVFLQICYPGDESVRLNNSSMRILWQLVSATLASLVLLGGCGLLFRQRAGIVLLHGGIFMLMFGELLVGLTAVESRLTVREGDTVNYIEHGRKLELAVVDTSDPDHDKVVVVPYSLLRNEGDRVSHEDLPFDVESLATFVNSELVPLKEGQSTLATMGHGKLERAVEKDPEPGTSNMPDQASAYFKLREKGGSKSIGTVLVSQWLHEGQKVSCDGKDYEVSLRATRNYQPFSMYLHDVRAEEHLGTRIPMKYSSDLWLTDPSRSVDQAARVWMNNPLRYGGQTFYQSSYAMNRYTGVEQSTLQVVTNTGWMVPYVACMVVGTGMFAQFWLVLGRFLKRRAKQETVPPSPGRRGAASRKRRRNRQDDTTGRSKTDYVLLLVPVLAVVVCAGYMMSRSRRPETKANQADFYAFGQLPVLYEGRVKPFDTLARNLLLVVSKRSSFEDADGEKQPATRWLLDLIARPGDAEEPKVFHIPNKELQETLGLKPRKGMKYALSEFRQNLPGFFKQVELAEEVPESDLSTYQQAVLKLRDNLNVPGWLLELMTTTRAADEHQVFRIENKDLQHTLGLEPRKGMRYALSEFREQLFDFHEQVLLAGEVATEDLSPYQRRVLKLIEKLSLCFSVEQGFVHTPLPSIPTHRDPESEDSRDDMINDLVKIRRTLEAAAANEQRLLESTFPRAAPWLSLDDESEDAAERAEEAPWMTYTAAWPRAYLQREFARMRKHSDHLQFEDFLQIFQDDVTRGYLRREFEKPWDAGQSLALHAVLDAYRENDVLRFNVEVANYRGLLEGRPPEEFNASMIDVESRFNHLQPFLWTSFTYVIVLVLVCVGWLIWEHETAFRVLHRTAMWLVVYTLLIHTVALIVRMVISGRPPVTNLYSSAVFIGWGAVILGLCFEWFYRKGVGLAIASLTGFLTLMVASYLSTQGDTLEPMRAVLDTQFWLATHVVIITLGYSATFVAGLLGVFYIVRGLFTRTLSSVASKDLHRMIYGTLCFAIIFNLVGTVLGGLWADDSWGRFWGWDPKENGALIIVLWNALVLHARFGGLVRDRGLAVLAVAGNIVTAWSWFGTNELKVGLHSYGFTEGVLLTLLIFAVSQSIIIGIGCIPTRYWLSFREHDPEKPEPAEIVT